MSDTPACRACGRTDEPCNKSCPYADQLRLEKQRPLNVKSDASKAPSSSTDKKPGQ